MLRSVTTLALNCTTPTVGLIGIVTRSLHGRLRNCASILRRDRLISIPPREALGPHLIQGLPGALSSGVKELGRQAGHSI